MYTPNRTKIFEDTEAGHECDNLSCSHHSVPETSRCKTPVCMANDHSECAKVNQVAAEINQFIADNDDVFMYIKPINE